MKPANEFLSEAAETFKQRNALYGNNFLHVGTILKGLFPEGLTVETMDDWNRLHILMLMIVKLSRYCNNWEAKTDKQRETRIDSMHDNTVYSAILESIDKLVDDKTMTTCACDHPEVCLSEGHCDKLFNGYR